MPRRTDANQQQQMDELRQLYILLPIVPPSINATYKYGKGRVYLSDAATSWSEQAALMIGCEAGRQRWRDNGSTYRLDVVFSRGKKRIIDVDAPMKLIIDTVTRKLFTDQDDMRIVKYSGERVLSDSEWCIVKLTPYAQRTC
ncbi:MAG: hypothetical protein ACYS30_19970 [Planctomycetota bacterium]|jgi:Holliday junction resolvase RusA-like endonuclease